VNVAWIAPYASDSDDTMGLYKLTYQKEAGRPAEPLTVSIDVPADAQIVETSPGLIVDGTRATYKGTPAGDVQMWVRYRFNNAAAPGASTAPLPQSVPLWPLLLALATRSRGYRRRAA